MTISFVRTGGGTLAVEIEGDGPLVICSPGLGDTRDAFFPLATNLVAEGYRVVRADLRGHGASSVDFAHYGDEATADDLLSLIDALGGGPAILTGASLSSAAAVIAAGRRPDSVAGLILLGPFLRNGVGEMKRWILQQVFARPWGPHIWRAYATKLWPGLGDRARDRARSLTDLLTRPGRWQAFQATLAGADHRVVEPWIRLVRAPVLVVMGDADPDWKNPIAEADWAASNFTDSKVIIVPGVGHAPMLERPDIVFTSVSKFLRQVLESSAPAPTDKWSPT